MEYFDLHCDTAYSLYHGKQSLKSNDLHVALDKASGFDSYTQVAAVWTDDKLTDEAGYADFWRILNYFRHEVDSNRHSAAICRSYSDLAELPKGTAGFLLAIEDARILSGNPERIREVYDAGVRILSMNWKGENSLGGAYDTNLPLTHLGRTVVQSALDLGMVIDVSHSSGRVIDEIAELAASVNKPIIATHSDCNSVAVHPRNLTDSQFIKIRQSGGLVGICLYPEHLSGSSNIGANVTTILNHIEYFLGLDGQYTVALGCDFDGIEKTPDDIANVADLYRLADAMVARNFSDELISAIFYRNAHNFFKKIL